MIVRRGGGWIWFFAALTVLCVAALVVMVLFNRGQQLTAEELTNARKRWEANGLASYVLDYRVTRITRDMTSTDDIVVKVKEGEVISVTVNGLPQIRKKFQYYGMDVLFDFVADYLHKNKQEKNRRFFTRGVFDIHDGHLKSFVRRVMGTRNQMEITVRSLKKWNSE